MGLRKVSRLARQWAKAPKPSNVRPAPKSQPPNQNGAAAAPQPVVTGGLDKASLDGKADDKPVDGVDALLATLASRNRPEPVASGGL